MKLRTATISDLNSIFMMGYDVWSDGQCQDEYLLSCHNSPKYKKGTWWILEDERSIKLSSAIAYCFGKNIWGIGSVSTEESCRRNGYASKLIMDLSNTLFDLEKAFVIYLYSDINPEFYKKQGFFILPDKFQKYQSSKCMVKLKNKNDKWCPSESLVPDYF